MSKNASIPLTNPNLPPGAAITSIDGVRCTAIPKSTTSVSITTSSSSLSSQSSLSSPPPPQPPQPPPPLPPPPPSSTSRTKDQVIQTPSPSPTSNAAASKSVGPPGSSAVPPAPFPDTTSRAYSPITPPPDMTAAVGSSRLADTPIASAAPSITTSISSSTTPVAIAQTAGNSPASTSEPDLPTNAVDPPKTSNTSNSGGVTISSPMSPKAPSKTGPIIGGVFGVIALVALVAVLFWLFRRKRKTNQDSLFSPLTWRTRKTYYDLDRDAIRPMSTSGTFKARMRGAVAGVGAGLSGIGAALNFRSERGGKPGVNLNRGNSQFIDGPSPTRKASTASAHSLHSNARERAADFWGGVAAKARRIFQLKAKDEEQDPVAVAWNMSEKQARLNKPQDFSRLLDVDDRRSLIAAEGRRASISSNLRSARKPGSLGQNFRMLEDPFADPKPKLAEAGQQPNQDLNPFKDPVPLPDAAVPRASTYIGEIRRSRGQSLDGTTQGDRRSRYGPAAYRTPSINNISRYPSSIAPSMDSYRDTMYSTTSNNPRKLAGRSDPFDLERPELWLPVLASSASKSSELDLVEPGRDQFKKITSTGTSIQSQGTYQSYYSSDESLMDEFGDPGPDVGRGSLINFFYGQEWDTSRNYYSARGTPPSSLPNNNEGIGRAR